MLREWIDGVIAGILVSIGGMVFLSCDNRYVGAILFSVALLCICVKGYALFTGRVGFIPEKHGKKDWRNLGLALLGNIVGTFAVGGLLRGTLPGAAAVSETLCAAKLTQQTLHTLIRAGFCGILMYLAVSTYKEGKTLAGIFFCVPVFILSGFEHSVADMFYFAMAGMITGTSLFYLTVVIVGNAIGGMLLPALRMLGKAERKNG